MSDEQRSMAHIQHQPPRSQPMGPSPIFRPAALSFAQVGQLHVAHGALRNRKMGDGRWEKVIDDTPYSYNALAGIKGISHSFPDKHQQAEHNG